jgi:hypothetical protein
LDSSSSLESLEASQRLNALESLETDKSKFIYRILDIGGG